MRESTSESLVELFDHVPCGILTTGGDDIVVRVNATFLQWTGYSRDEVVGRTFLELLHPASQAAYATGYQEALFDRLELREVAFTVVRKNGSLMPILVNAEFAKDGTEPNTVRLAIFDATNRQDYEQQLLDAKRLAESSEASVRVLQQAATRFLAARTEAELGTAVSESARDAFGAIDVAVVGYDPDGVRFRVVVGDHLRPLMDAVRESRPPGSRALAADEVLVISDLDDALARSVEVARHFEHFGAQAFSAVPIASGDEVLGAFVCLFAEPRNFDRAAIELQMALARQAGLVLSRVRLEVQLERLALHDQLTGLANRNLLDERLSQALAAAERSGQSMALIFADLDGFKQINDDLGHRVGDKVLQVVAARMNNVVRDVDIVGRFGGDEFLVVCETADETAARHVAERLADEIRQPIDFLPDGVGVTASVGIAVYTPGEAFTPTPDALVLRADAAMYDSKNSGADRTTVYYA